MRVQNIPPQRPFLDTLAALWLASTGNAPAEGLILLPTRRAARALAEAFLRTAGGRPLLLPRITALGGIDETPLALAGALFLPPAIDPQLRLAMLSRMILAMHGEGVPRRRPTAPGCWRGTWPTCSTRRRAPRSTSRRGCPTRPHAASPRTGS